MRAFLMYIDDWLSSKHIARMDAAEERGYLRLLLYAATEPDCGLPNSDEDLSVISLLGPQWEKPTQDESKRFTGRTSGEKLRACFFEKDGRLFNERLLKEFTHQKEVSQKRAAFGKLGAEAKAQAKASRLLTHMPMQRDKQNATNDVCVYVSPVVSISSSKKNQDASDFDPIGSFDLICGEYPQAGRVRIEFARGIFFDVLQTESERHGKTFEQIFAEMLAGLDRWKASAQWKRGAVNNLSNFIGERLWKEEPLSAVEAAQQREVPKKAAPGDFLRRRLAELEKKEATQ